MPMGMGGSVKRLRRCGKRGIIAITAGGECLMNKPPFLTRVKLRNYKSIARCDVELGPLGILVGPNGSGKSNFLDALDLAYDALMVPMAQALAFRGGVREILFRGGSRSTKSFGVSLNFALPDGAGKGMFSFEIEAQRNDSFSIRKEVCQVDHFNSDFGTARYEAQSGNIINHRSNVKDIMPAHNPDRLMLQTASSLDVFRPVYDALTNMRFYKFSPEALRGPLVPDPAELLRPNYGRNLASVLGKMEMSDDPNFGRVQDYLRALAPNIENAKRIGISVLNAETIQFTQRFDSHLPPKRFTATSISDGTLRALAILIALLQGGAAPPSLVGIEEPEAALHPAAAGVLWDALNDGSERAQVLITTHSPDLLDRKDVPAEAILAVDMEAGRTQIGPLTESSRRSLQNRLMSAGELLRQGRLTPLESALTAPTGQQ